MAHDMTDLRHLLELEYEHLQKAAEKFDEHRARLKGWMITGVAGVTAAGFGVGRSSIFWAGALLVVLFGMSEVSYIDVQEDAIVRGRMVERLPDRLSRGDLGPEHEAYEFGIGQVFRGGRVPRLGNVVRWLGYRTFNPVLYFSVFALMVVAALLVP